MKQKPLLAAMGVGALLLLSACHSNEQSAKPAATSASAKAAATTSASASPTEVTPTPSTTSPTPSETTSSVAPTSASASSVPAAPATPVRAKQTSAAPAAPATSSAPAASPTAPVQDELATAAPVQKAQGLTPVQGPASAPTDIVPTENMSAEEPAQWGAPQVLPGNQLRIGFTTGMPDCYGVRTKVVETGTNVSVTLLRGKVSGAPAQCDTETMQVTMVVQLAAPLGNRALVVGS